MRLAELYGARAVDRHGKSLGRVVEVYVELAAVGAIGIGAANFLERLLGRRRGLRIGWEKVKRIESGRIVVDRG